MVRVNIPDRIRLYDIVVLALIALGSLLLRIPFLSMPMIADEGGYAYAARNWLYGDSHLYQDLFISRPQGIFLLYAGIFETLGTQVEAFRIASWIACALTSVAVWAIARYWLSPRGALLAAALQAVLVSSPGLEGFTANAEIFMALPSAIVCWLVMVCYTRGWTPARLFAIGMLIGVATQLKPSGIVMLFVAVALLELTQALSIAERIRQYAWLVGGLSLIGIPTLIHGYMLGWDKFVYATVTYRLTSQSSMTVTFGEHLSAIAFMFTKSASVCLVVLVTFLISQRHRYARRAIREAWTSAPRMSQSLGIARMSDASVDMPEVLIRIWVLACLGGIAMGGDWWSHYLIQLVAPVSIWVASSWINIWNSVKRIPRYSIFSMFSVFMLAGWWMLFPGNLSAEEVARRMWTSPGYPAQDEVAEYINTHSDPDDRIYVAFDQAAIYFLADRESAYTYLYAQELEAIDSSYEEILALIESEDRPVYIVSTREADIFPDHGTRFWQLVGTYYELETVVEGVPIYRVKAEFYQSDE